MRVWDLGFNPKPLRCRVEGFKPWVVPGAGYSGFKACTQVMQLGLSALVPPIQHRLPADEHDMKRWILMLALIYSPQIVISMPCHSFSLNCES